MASRLPQSLEAPQARRQGGVPAPGRGRSGSQVPPPFLHLPGSGHFLSPSAHSHGPLRSRGRGGVRKWGEVTHFAEHLLQPARWAPLRAEHPGRRGARGAGGRSRTREGAGGSPLPKSCEAARREDACGAEAAGPGRRKGLIVRRLPPCQLGPQPATERPPPRGGGRGGKERAEGAAGRCSVPEPGRARPPPSASSAGTAGGGRGGPAAGPRRAPGAAGHQAPPRPRPRGRTLFRTRLAPHCGPGPAARVRARGVPRNFAGEEGARVGATRGCATVRGGGVDPGT